MKKIYLFWNEKILPQEEILLEKLENKTFFFYPTHLCKLRLQYNEDMQTVIAHYRNNKLRNTLTERRKYLNNIIDLARLLANDLVPESYSSKTPTPLLINYLTKNLPEIANLRNKIKFHLCSIKKYNQYINKRKIGEDHMSIIALHLLSQSYEYYAVAIWNSMISDNKHMNTENIMTILIAYHEQLNWLLKEKNMLLFLKKSTPIQATIEKVFSNMFQTFSEIIEYNIKLEEKIQRALKQYFQQFYTKYKANNLSVSDTKDIIQLINTAKKEITVKTNTTASYFKESKLNTTICIANPTLQTVCYENPSTHLTY